MDHLLQLQPIQLDSIELGDRTFSLAPGDEKPDDLLTKSIERFGILHPPILYEIRNNQYGIVTGRKRIKAMTPFLGPDDTIFCHSVPPQTPRKNIFALLLEETIITRPLTPAEQILFFDKFLAVASVAEALPLLGRLGHEPQEHVLDNLLKLRSLSPCALQALHQNTISTNNGRKLLQLDDEDQTLIVRLITDLRLGGSKQRQLIDLCREMIMRENTSLAQLLHQFPQINTPRQHENTPQLASALLAWLKNKNLPMSTQAENKFKKEVAALRLPPGISVDHTPSFEDQNLTLTLRFTDWQSLKNALQKIIENPEPKKTDPASRQSHGETEKPFRTY